MKTISIKGKPYVMVNERVKEFREIYPNLNLVTEMLQCNEDNCIFKATVIDDNGVIKAVGHAQEDRASSMINKTSYIENAETSAVGRALGFLGIGISDSIASAEEVSMAIQKQEIENTPTPIECKCCKCGCEVSEKVAKYSKSKLGSVLCYKCQSEYQKESVKEIEL